MTTLAPMQTLLNGVVLLLEQEVLPHVAGRPFNAAKEAVELARAIVAALGGEEVPDYCEEAGCQNRKAGPSDLCTSHLIEFAIGRRVLR